MIFLRFFVKFVSSCAPKTHMSIIYIFSYNNERMRTQIVYNAMLYLLPRKLNVENP
jgi:hypothetical protein